MEDLMNSAVVLLAQAPGGKWDYLFGAAFLLVVGYGLYWLWENKLKDKFR